MPYDGRLHGLYLADLIKNNSYKIIAEIGVYKSKTIETIYSSGCVLDQYWGIDPWCLYRKMHLENKERGKEHMIKVNAMYQYSCSLMLTYPFYRILKMHSVEAAKLFPMRYFDLVFIDADHSYQAVIDDIKVWLPLVKIGGKLTGHDYGGGQNRGVTKAVDEILGKENILSYKRGYVWEYDVNE